MYLLRIRDPAQQILKFLAEFVNSVRVGKKLLTHKFNYMKQKYWGQLMSIDMHGCEHSRLIDKELLQKFCLELCKEIDMKPYWSPLIERFWSGELEWYSLIQFIETSSITIHLDEVWNRAFVDIFSCKLFDKIRAKKFSKHFFQAKEIRFRNFYR